jgi:hypothetical protein
MNKQLVGIRAALSENVFRRLSELCLCKDRALDEERLRRLVQRAIDRSWLLHRAIETNAYARLTQAYDERKAANDAVTSARRDLKTVLDDPGQGIDLLVEAEFAERFAKAQRKLQVVETGFEKAVEQAVRDFKEIEFMERDRLMDALRMLEGEFVMLSSSMPRDGPGRPSRKDHLECRFFVYEFVTAVERAGGKLKFNKNYGGPLFDALEQLAPHLPPPVAEDLSFRLLADVRRKPRHKAVEVEIPYFINGVLLEMIRDGKFAVLQGEKS